MGEWSHLNGYFSQRASLGIAMKSVCTISFFVSQSGSGGGGGATFWSLALACGQSMHPGESISAQSRFAKVFAKVYGNQRGRSTEAHTLFF